MSADQKSAVPVAKLRAPTGSLEVAGLSALLLVSACAQRLGFKLAGYGLGGTPFLMILLSVAGSVPCNALLYLYMMKRTGGVLPKYKTWRYFFDYWVIATLNIGNGLAIMWANPFVPGYTQCLISNTAIPMTMLLSTICFQTRYSIAAYTGVLVIVLGLVIVSGSPSHEGSSASMLWTGIFIAAQFPLSAACVYQEYAFRESLNMVHYIHYVTLILLGDLVVAVPLDVRVGDAQSYLGFKENALDALRCVANVGPPNCEGVGFALACYIFGMNAGNLFQALLIKRVDATWYMVVLSLSTPLAAISFACPMLVGELHTESLDYGAIVSIVLIGIGTIIYRIGSLPSETPDNEAEDPNGEGYEPLGDGPQSPRPTKDVAVQTVIAVGPEMHDARMLLNAFLKSDSAPQQFKPKIIAAGFGLIASEYSNDRRNPMSLFDEHTFKDTFEREQHSEFPRGRRSRSHDRCENNGNHEGSRTRQVSV